MVAWSAHGLRRCAPETLEVIAALLLEPCDLAQLLPAGVRQQTTKITSAALARIVARVHDDGGFAARLARRLTHRAHRVAHLLERSPFEILSLWGARSPALSRHEIGAMLGRLACTGDAALEPLARRLCRDVQLEALRGPRNATTDFRVGLPLGGDDARVRSHRSSLHSLP